MINDNYNRVKSEIFEILSKNKHVVLATSFKDIVTARTISYVFIDEKILFQTLSSYVKTQQIEKNSNVALCIDNLQIEGKAKVVGNPLEKNNEIFLNEYKKIHKSAYEKYSMLKDEVVIEVVIEKISRWFYKNNKGYKESINLITKGYDINE